MDETSQGVVGQAWDMAIDASGNIVLCGTTAATGSYDLGVVRYTSTGLRDTTFGGGDGHVEVPFNSGNDLATSLAILSDGKILTGGYVPGASGGLNFALARFTSTGALDTGFGSSGKREVDVTGTDDVCYAMTVLPGGSILLGGWATVGGTTGSALARFTSGGDLDTTFDGDGLQYRGALGSISDFSLQSDGKYVAVGSSTAYGNVDFAIARYTAAGKLDAVEVTDYVWNAEYIDSLAMRLRDLNGDGDVADDGERLYPGYDANYNITMVVGLESGAWGVSERYTYTAYGYCEIRMDDFTPDADGKSNHDWRSLYTTRELDPETGLYYYRARYYDADMGRFIGRDPIEYAGDDLSLYRYVSNRVVTSTDPSGNGPLDKFLIPYKRAVKKAQDKAVATVAGASIEKLIRQDIALKGPASNTDQTVAVGMPNTMPFTLKQFKLETVTDALDTLQKQGDISYKVSDKLTYWVRDDGNKKQPKILCVEWKYMVIVAITPANAGKDEKPTIDIPFSVFDQFNWGLDSNKLSP